MVEISQKKKLSFAGPFTFCTYFFPEFLQSRVEVPVLGIVTGGVAGFVTLLILTLMVLCLLHKDKTKIIGTHWLVSISI